MRRSFLSPGVETLNLFCQFFSRFGRHVHFGLAYILDFHGRGPAHIHFARRVTAAAAIKARRFAFRFGLVLGQQTIVDPEFRMHLETGRIHPAAATPTVSAGAGSTCSRISTSSATATSRVASATKSVHRFYPFCSQIAGVNAIALLFQFL